MKITFVDLTPYCRFVENLGSSDLESAIKVHDAYLRNCHGESIMDIGMNQYTGYVYIALENGVQIASCFGQDVEYIKVDFETGKEEFFNTYQEAIS